MSKEDKGRIKMTVVHFETESDNETLKENIRSISMTLVKALTSNSQRINQPHLITNGEKVIEDANIVDELDPEEVLFENNSRPKAKKAANRQVPQPKALDLDLKSGDMSLKTFLDKVNPSSTQQKYLAIAFWFKKYRNIEEIGSDHAYTCLRHMTWPVPSDPGQPFRNMKTTKYGWFNAGKTTGTFIITHLGENVVDKMLK